MCSVNATTDYCLKNGSCNGSSTSEMLAYDTLNDQNGSSTPIAGTLAFDTSSHQANTFSDNPPRHRNGSSTAADALLHGDPTHENGSSKSVKLIFNLPSHQNRPSSAAITSENGAPAHQNEYNKDDSFTYDAPTHEADDTNNQEPPVPPSAFKSGPANVTYSELVRLPNPYRWPLNLLSTGLKLNGVDLHMAPVKDDPQTRAKKIRALPMRADDILLAAFPKCGTHWLSEMLNHLLKGSHSLESKHKSASMIEFIDDLASLDSRPSPRFFNSHLQFAHLPKQVAEKKIKIVHIVRNSKDAVVSWYHHIRQYFVPSSDANFENITFDNFLKGYMEDGYSTHGHQFNYLRQLSEFERSNPDHPIKHVHFEDLKEDAESVLQDLAEFLAVPASRDRIREIVEMCSLQNMRKLDQARGQINGSHHVEIFRKGAVGDWKNTFTVAQNERFDAFIQEQRKKSPASFILTEPTLSKVTSKN